MELRDKTRLAWELLKANPLAGAIGFILIVALLMYLAGSVQQRWQDGKTDRAVEKLERQSSDLQQKAHEEISKADKASGAREAEEAHRKLEIKPAIERASRNRATARAATQKAEKDYEISITVELTNPELDALHRRNCSDYSELYSADLERHCSQ